MYWFMSVANASCISRKVQCVMCIVSYLPARDSVSPSFSKRRDEPSSTTFMSVSLNVSISHSLFIASLQLSILCTSSMTRMYSWSLLNTILARTDSHTSFIHVLLSGLTLSAVTYSYGMVMSVSTCFTIVDFPTCRGPEITCILVRFSSSLSFRILYSGFLNMVFYVILFVYLIMFCKVKQNSQSLQTKFSICACKILNLALQNSQFSFTEFSMCMVVNVVRCWWLVDCWLLYRITPVLALDYSSTFILVVKEQ